MTVIPCSGRERRHQCPKPRIPKTRNHRNRREHEPANTRPSGPALLLTPPGHKLSSRVAREVFDRPGLLPDGEIRISGSDTGTKVIASSRNGPTLKVDRSPAKGRLSALLSGAANAPAVHPKCFIRTHPCAGLTGKTRFFLGREV